MALCGMFLCELFSSELDSDCDSAMLRAKRKESLCLLNLLPPKRVAKRGFYLHFPPDGALRKLYFYGVNVLGFMSCQDPLGLDSFMEGAGTIPSKSNRRKTSRTARNDCKRFSLVVWSFTGTLCAGVPLWRQRGAQNDPCLRQRQSSRSWQTK